MGMCMVGSVACMVYMIGVYSSWRVERQVLRSCCWGSSGWLAVTAGSMGSNGNGSGEGVVCC